MNKHTFVTVGIFIGLLLGLLVGELLFRGYQGNVDPAVLEGFKFVGDTFFMRLLKMILVPLVASSVIVGVASIGDPGKLGRVGGLTVAYYFSTMVIAVVIGVVLVTSIAPGKNLPAEFREKKVAEFSVQEETATAKSRIEDASGTGLVGAFQHIVKQMIPENPIGAAAEGKILPTICFSLLFGIVLTVVGPRGKPVVDFFQAVFAAIMKLVEWILYLAPLGVFCLVVWTVADIGSAQLVGPLLKYVLTVLIGLAIHGIIILPLVLWMLGRCNPYRYMWQMKDALMTAFGTDSSSATLPVTIEAAQNFGGCSKRSSEFVLPLGATINMDGTALYEAVAVVFLFQYYDIALGPVQLAIVVVTATLAAVGAAGIPSAGLVTMVIVIEAVNGSLGGSVTPLPLLAAGVIYGVDRILDMCRTTVNVWGDAAGAKIITRIAPDPPAPEAQP